MDMVIAGSRITSKDYIALQLYWQGYEAYVHCIDGVNAAPCFYNNLTSSNTPEGSDILCMVPIEESRERSIFNEMKVQIMSLKSRKYLRVTRWTKYLQWSTRRDEKTVFQVQCMGVPKLLSNIKFTLSSCLYPNFAVGFTQKVPVGGLGGSGAEKAVGFLTLEKKSSKPPSSLLFPLRLRAIHRSDEATNLFGNASLHSPQITNRSSVPTFQQPHTNSSRRMSLPTMGSNSMDYYNEIRGPALVEAIPLASVVPIQGVHNQSHGNEVCIYCSRVFNQSSTLLQHVREVHCQEQDQLMHNVVYCVSCRHVRFNGACTTCY